MNRNSPINRLRTLSARFFTRTGIGSIELRIRAYAWLAAMTDNYGEKARLLGHILEMDPALDWAQAAHADMLQRAGEGEAAPPA